MFECLIPFSEIEPPVEIEQQSISEQADERERADAAPKQRKQPKPRRKPPKQKRGTRPHMGCAQHRARPEQNDEVRPASVGEEKNTGQQAGDAMGGQPVGAVAAHPSGRREGDVSHGEKAKATHV